MAFILVADDEASIRDVVQYALEREGHRVETVKNGREALERFPAGRTGQAPGTASEPVSEPVPDLVILDVLMPELDGLSACRKLRERSDVPVIFLSSRGEEVDRILGLELGGDDYLTKPFSPRELTARVAVVLRRLGPAALAARAGGPEAAPVAGPSPAAASPRGRGPRTQLAHAGVLLDAERREVRAAGERVDLTVTEFDLLWALFERPGVVLSRGQLLGRLREPDVHLTERTVDTHIRRVRAKLRPHGIDPVETVHGLGYRACEL
jgi:two-component system OmpR family response regulator